MGDAEPDEAIEMPNEIPELEPLSNALLTYALAAHPMPFSLGGFAHDHGCTASVGAGAAGQLELHGLVHYDLRGRRLTREGVAVARWLDSRDDAPS